MLDLNLNGPVKKTYREMSDDIEKNMRERVQTFLKKVFVEDEMEEDDIVMGDMSAEIEE